MARRAPSRSRSPHLVLCWALFAWLLPQPDALAAPASDEPSAQAVQIDSELTAAAQRGLAERFAPVLVFHPSEKYFPTSPLFPIDVRAPFDGQQGDAGTPLSLLGTAASRRERYESLTRREKARLATVYYRAYHARLDGQPVIVIEYWLYYVQNTYRVRGNLFPFWVDGSHPNDLEHIHVVVRSTADSTLTMHEVFSSAHNGTMPANRHRFANEGASEHQWFLVELGSHAVAPDVNQDGVFTPGTDGSSGYKMLWGIRDRGITWARYSSHYMDARSETDSVTFEYAGAEPGDQERSSYRLVPVGELTGSFRDLEMTAPERRAIFETDRHWFRRLFGGDNGSSRNLLVPPAPSATTESIGIDRVAGRDRGFLVGTQLNLEQQGLLLGARYKYPLGGAYMPDVMVEADGVLTRRQRYVSAQVLVTYPIDGSTTLMVGKALVTDSLTLRRRQSDWVAALEFPVGHMRVFVASRSWGPITRFTKEIRVSYFF